MSKRCAAEGCPKRISPDSKRFDSVWCSPRCGARERQRRHRARLTAQAIAKGQPAPSTARPLYVSRILKISIPSAGEEGTKWTSVKDESTIPRDT